MLCTCSMLFYASFNMLLPELPDYLSNIGGQAYKGLIIGFFTLTAGISRPFSGRLCDQWGRVPVMVVGASICVICSLIYPFTHTVFPFLLLRFCHGFSTGFTPTGTAAYIADTAPASRRGEAMGIYGLVSSSGMALGPVLGSWITSIWSLNTLFVFSSVMALTAATLLFRMPETLPATQKRPFSFKLFKIGWEDVFHKPIWPIAVVVYLTAFSFGTVITLAPDLTKIVGLNNKGLYYLLFTCSSLFIRVLAGKLSDRKGRISVLIWGVSLLILAMLCTANTGHKMYFYAGGILFGIAYGIVSPTYQAWTIDRCTKQTRGRAVATMFIAMEAGIGSGAVFPMLLYANKPEQIGWAYILSATMALLALFFLLWYKTKDTGVAIIEEND